MRRPNPKNILLVLILAVLCMPLVQYNLNIFKPGELIGYYEPAADAKFTKQEWWGGTYQEQKDKYINDHVGFRPDLVRLNNQIDFSLFRVIHAITVLGKDEYIFYEGYIDSYLGKDFLGSAYIGDVAIKMKYLNDEFRKEGKTFALVISASKADVFHEYISDKPTRVKQPHTNREVYKQYCDSLGVPCIDFNDMFLELKKTEPMIFARQGIHWTRYGAMFAVDSLYKFIEQDRHIDLPDFKLYYVKTDKPRGADNDVGSALNLIYPIQETFVYPVITFTNDTLKEKPSAVYIGDSFMWLLLDDSLAHMHKNNKIDFWHYFKEVFHDDKLLTIDNFDWRSELDKTDCVIIAYTTINMHHVKKFVDAAYVYYKEKEQKRKTLSLPKNATANKE